MNIKTGIQILLFLCCFAAQSCINVVDGSGGSEFADDFENASGAAELFPADKSRWTFSQRTMSLNEFSIDTSYSHSGKNSLRCSAQPTASEASKCSIAKQNMSLKAGENIEYSAWYYIDSDEALPYLFLADLEESTAIGASPGLRVAFDEDGRSLEIERGKMVASTIHQVQPSRAFPRKQWVHLTLRILLSQHDDGFVQVYQDGLIIIDEHGVRTMPVDVLYNIQGTKGVYNSIEVGITANSHSSSVVLYLDDVWIRKL